jgi:hypothetical protein
MPSHTKSTADVTAIGIDIGKITFHLIGQDRRGKIVMRARVSRSQLMERLANVPRCLIGMEAGAGAHHIARRLLELGHNVRLIPAQYVCLPSPDSLQQVRGYLSVLSMASDRYELGTLAQINRWRLLVVLLPSDDKDVARESRCSTAPAR